MSYPSLLIFSVLVFVGFSECKKVAIIGGGIGGSSAGHFVRELLDIKGKTPHEVTLFERANRIGGRLLSHDFDGYRQEIGADVCHLGNFFCVQFARKAGFDVYDRTSIPVHNIAIRNGTDYLFNSDYYSWEILNLLNTFATFGMDTLFLESYVKESFHKWQKQYTDSNPWTSIKEFLTRYELINNINISLEDAMIERGFKKTIIRGLVTAITKVIYQLEADKIHALAGQISITGSLNGDQLFTIPNGNELMAQYLVRESGVKLELNTSVISIAKKENGFVVVSKRDENEVTEEFDYVVIATPLGIVV